MVFSQELSLFLSKNTAYRSPPENPPLEESLHSLLTEEELATLKLPFFLRPKILRGLPRFIQPHNRKKIKIKSPFADLKVLKRHWIDKALLYLYQAYFEPQEGSFLLLTFAFSDGRGDLYTHLHTHAFLKTHFPQLHGDPLLFRHHAFDWEAKNPSILYTQRGKNQIIHEAFSKEHLRVLERADLLFEIPTAFPLTPLLKKQYPKKTFERLGEQSLIEAASFHPKEARCMGLHFLEKGVFIKEKIHPSFADVKKAYFAPFLGKARFNFAYTKTSWGTSLYVLTLFYALQHSPEDLDMCLFQFPTLIDFTSHEMDAFQGIQTLEIYTDTTKTMLPLHKRGKRVRFFLCNSLSHEETLALSALSYDLIGCTGDQSVLEALATQRPFLYDPPPFKRLFLKDLCLLAPNPEVKAFFKFSLHNETLTPPIPDAGYLSEEWVEWMDERLEVEEGSLVNLARKMGTLLNSKALQKGFSELSKHLAKNYPLEPILKGIVSRTFCHRKHKNIADLEKKLMNLFLKGEISAGALLKALQKALSSLGF